jgi:hypothetical protein
MSALGVCAGHLAQLTVRRARRRPQLPEFFDAPSNLSSARSVEAQSAQVPRDRENVCPSDARHGCNERRVNWSLLLRRESRGSPHYIIELRVILEHAVVAAALVVDSGRGLPNLRIAKAESGKRWQFDVTRLAFIRNKQDANIGPFPNDCPRAQP